MKKFLLPFILAFLCITVCYSQNDGWNITTTNHDNYTGVVVANGRIGILPSYKPFTVEQIILNNVYEKESELGVSRILKGMNFGNLDLEIDGEKITENNISDWKQTLNMKEARFTTSFNFKDKARVTYSIYALRNLPYAGYIDISVEAKKDIKVKATGKILTPEDFKNPNSTFRVLKDLETTMPILQTVASSKFGRQKVATSATFIWHDINSSREDQRPELTQNKVSEYDNELSFQKSIQKGKSLDFAWAAAETSSQDFFDPQNESERFVIFCLLNSKESLLKAHKDLWANLWKGDIIIDGDLQTQQDVRLALYH
ncbi:MAG: glycoside hydrolase family 65 protein, partial [Gillisia sp.]